MQENGQEVAQIALFHGVDTPFEICEVSVKVSKGTKLLLL